VLIAVFNVFFGGTGIGWIIALLWALNVQITISPLRTPIKQP
jgi:hypothetical protein